LAFAFSPYHLKITPVIEQFIATNPGTSLSQTTDAYTSTVPLVCGIEVKEEGSDYNEAVMQLVIWSATGLETLKELNPDLEYANLNLFVGWIVISYKWKLHLAWKGRDGRVDWRLSRPVYSLGVDKNSKLDCV